MTNNDPLSAIKETGYWRVLVRPTEFKSRRIVDRAAALRIVRDNKLALRGWDYPHVEEPPLVNKDWTGSRIDWGEHKEYWRLYLSGQFVHYFTMMEDFHQVPWTSSAFSGGRPDKYIEIISTLYRVTEIYEFARRLAAEDVLSPAAEISITLSGNAGRVLVYWHIGERFLERHYVSNTDQIISARAVSAAELAARANELAMETTVDIFEQFNWLSPPLQLLHEDQKKLLERRLGA